MTGPVLALVAAAAAAGAPGAGGLFSLMPDNPLQGSRLFTAKGCLECHPVQSAGGRGGPDLGRGRLSRPLLEIAGVLWNHSPRMEHAFKERHVARPRFDAKEMASLLAFLYYLGSLDEPGDAALGQRLFTARGCSQCHAVGGKGGTTAPELDRFGGYASPLFLSSALWNAGPPMARAMKKAGVVRQPFEGKDIADLLAFIRRDAGGLQRVYAQPGNPRRGEALFATKGCSGCHSINGRGGSEGARQQRAPHPPDLGRELKGSLSQVAGAMWNHGPAMWASMAARGVPAPRLTPDETGDLVSYLYFLQFIDRPGDATRGAAVYRDARCGTCHDAVEGGKRVAPSLADSERYQSSLQIVASMWNHGAQMERVMAEAKVDWPMLKGSEMADLVAYLLSARSADRSAGR